MTAAVKDLDIEQGATWRVTFNLTDKATTLPIDITGFIFRGNIKKIASATSEVLASFVFTPVAPLTDGKVLVELPADVSSGLAISGASYASITSYPYDMEMVDPLGTVTRLMNGKVKFSPEVTTTSGIMP